MLVQYLLRHECKADATKALTQPDWDALGHEIHADTSVSVLTLCFAARTAWSSGKPGQTVLRCSTVCLRSCTSSEHDHMSWQNNIASCICNAYCHRLLRACFLLSLMSVESMMQILCAAVSCCTAGLEIASCHIVLHQQLST